ncbi:protein of unknown function [Tenacibaculum jejuense]|uniref:Uncharacterized protein n=1 Tax=Tenacibaculum jejuense TaxID=584609 RepID=A0A238UH52_9FLAO|nr:protein of unknown function [Tenacibaculum jejuense]
MVLLLYLLDKFIITRQSRAIAKQVKLIEGTSKGKMLVTETNGNFITITNKPSPR